MSPEEGSSVSGSNTNSVNLPSLSSRGDLLPIMDKYSWGDAEEALRDALKMEKFITKEIKSIIDVCSSTESNVSDW